MSALSIEHEFDVLAQRVGNRRVVVQDNAALLEGTVPPLLGLWLLACRQRNSFPAGDRDWGWFVSR